MPNSQATRTNVSLKTWQLGWHLKFAGHLERKMPITTNKSATAPQQFVLSFHCAKCLLSLNKRTAPYRCRHQKLQSSISAVQQLLQLLHFQGSQALADIHEAFMHLLVDKGNKGTWKTVPIKNTEVVLSHGWTCRDFLLKTNQKNASVYSLLHGIAFSGRGWETLFQPGAVETLSQLMLPTFLLLWLDMIFYEIVYEILWHVW